MKVIKQIVFVVLYVIAMFVTVSLFSTKHVDNLMRVFTSFMLLCTIIFVVATEIYHKNKNSVKPLITLAVVFIVNLVVLSTLSDESALVSLASIMFAILFTRHIFNNDQKFLGCYNLWLFSAFTVLLTFIMIFNGSLFIVLAALITLLSIAKLKHTNNIEYQKVSYIQTIAGLILITVIMVFL